MAVRRLLVPLALLIGTVSLIPPAQAQYPPTGPTLTLSSSVVGPGGTLTVSGTGFEGNSDVNITGQRTGNALGGGGRALPAAIVRAAGNIQLGRVRALADGTFTTRVTMPTVPGRYTVFATGRSPSGAIRELTARVTVTRGRVPFTGAATTDSGTRTGVLLVLLGAAAIFAAARLRRRPALAAA